MIKSHAKWSSLDDHGDVGDDHNVINGSLGEEKMQPYGAQGKGINRILHFGDQDTIEGVITLRINSRTIKRGISRAIDHLSATR
jgi:hypothetical protein